MATEIKLPRLGQGMESGTIVKWLKREGEEVAKGEPLYELDTDKVTQEVEADAGGVLLKIAVREGEVPVGRTIAVIGEAGEEVEEPEEAKVDGDQQEEGSPGPAREEERERGRHGPGGSRGRRGRRARGGVGAGDRTGDRRDPERSRHGGRGGAGRAALDDAEDDCTPADGGLAGAGLPARRHRGHGARAV